MSNKYFGFSLLILVAIYIVYGIASCFYIAFSGSDVQVIIFNIFLIVLICFALCLIFILSSKKLWGKFLRKIERNKQAKEFEDLYSYQEDDSIPLEKGYFKNKITFKKFIQSFMVLIALGLGYIPLTILSVNEFSRIYSSNFVKTEAVVTNINHNGEKSSLKYVYYCKETNKSYIYSGGSSFSGVTFKEGKKITIYYNINNPEIAKTASTGVLTAVVAIFFLLLGFMVFMFQLGYVSNSFNAIMAGLIFSITGFGFSFGIALSGGFNFIEASLSGPLSYAINCLALLGILFIVYGVAYRIKTTIYFSRKKI